MSEGLFERIKGWLTEEGVFKEIKEDEHVRCHCIIEYPLGSGAYMDVIQPRDRNDLVVIISGVRLQEDHIEGLKAMGSKKRDALIWDMRFNLLFLPTSFRVMPDSDGPEYFEFSRELYEDGLTKNLLMDSLKQVYRCNLFVVWRMKRHFGESPRSSRDPMYG